MRSKNGHTHQAIVTAPPRVERCPKFILFKFKKYIYTLIFLKMVRSAQDIFSTGEKNPSACPKLFIYSSKSNFESEFLQFLQIFSFFLPKVNSGVQDSHLLKGKVINLVMDCTAAWLGNQIVNLGSCLVFKLEGTETCKLVSHF